MFSFKKVSSHFIFLLSLILSVTIGFFSYCTHKAPNQLDLETIHNYEIQLDSLHKKTDEISGLDNPSELIAYYKKSLNILKLLPDTSKSQVRIRLIFLKKFYGMGAYEEGIKVAWQIISIEKSSIRVQVNRNLEVYGLLAGMYKRIGKADSAMIVHRRAVTDVIHHRDNLMITGPLNNAGMYFYALGNYDSAWAYYNHADSLLNACMTKAKSWVIFQGSIKDNMATIYEDQGNFTKAKDIYTRNLSLYENTNDNFRWINAGISLANAESKLQNYKRAVGLLDSINDNMDILDYKNKHINKLYLFEVYTKYYLGIGDVRKAFIYQKKAFNLSDSLVRIEKKLHSVTSRQLAKYASQKFELDMHMERLAKNEEILRNRFLIWIVILISLSAIITLAIFYYSYKQRIRLQREKVKRFEIDRLLDEEKLKTREQEKQLLNLELDFKKKDLSDMAISLSQKKERAEGLYSQIIKVEKSKGKQRQKEFRELKEELQHQRNADKEIDYLQQNIDILSKGFYDKLKNSFPDLSKTEVKYCSFIKLNFSTTQIAQLQNISPKSVKMSRYRLKKKLGLSPEQNLDNFLQSF